MDTLSLLLPVLLSITPEKIKMENKKEWWYEVLFQIPALSLGQESCTFNMLYIGQQEKTTGPWDVVFVVNS